MASTEWRMVVAELGWRAPLCPGHVRVARREGDDVRQMAPELHGLPCVRCEWDATVADALAEFCAAPVAEVA